MALGHLSLTNLRWLSKKEVSVGLLNGVVWSIIVAIATYIWFEDTAIALIIATAMILNLIATSIADIISSFYAQSSWIESGTFWRGSSVNPLTIIVGFLSFPGLTGMAISIMKNRLIDSKDNFIIIFF